MRYAPIALLSAAVCLPPLATPATAQVISGIAPGCGRCGVSYTAVAPAGGPMVGAQLNPGVPSGAAALAPETRSALAAPSKGCHVEAWGGTHPRHRHTVCR